MPNQRRATRLKDYDYREEGAYFVTICTHQRESFFGDIHDDAMLLNRWGEIVKTEWEQTAIVRPNVELDAFVVMPNHIHGIIVIMNNPMATQRVATTNDKSRIHSGSLGAIIGQFKSSASKKILQLPDVAQKVTIWQRNYYDHIIRNEADLNRIREYVANNPAKWQEDSLYP